MAHGLNSVLKRGATAVGCKNEGKTGIGSRRIFAPHFKLQVLDSYRNDADCKGNQRATARKYGIHRRQIQKWLQVENNLRNSVVKGRPAEGEPEAALRSARQHDDVVVVPESRVPALSPASAAPLDFTTHSRGSPFVASSPPPAADPAAPMDLSLKKPTPMAAGVVNAPATYCPPSPLRVPSPPSLAQPHPDVWDLSTKRKCEDPTPLIHSPTSSDCQAKPVKLFKPYLDDVFDTTIADSDKNKPSSVPPCCSIALSNCEAYYYNNNNNHINNNNNNNNNICDIKSEYTTTYTLHELQPKTSLNYYYTFPSTYHTNPEYEMNSFCANYDDPSYIHSVVPLKQRHSYSLDFKLSAIECYYQDSVCKGNQRAVATKYNIHRRQVQKWLKQADELRQKNETIKQTQSVR